MTKQSGNPPPEAAPQGLGERLERAVEGGIFHARWLLAPIYIGLLLGLAALVLAFGKELLHLGEVVLDPKAKPESIILLVLSLIDLCLAANLVIIVVFSGFESFVSKIDNADHPDRPEWMGKIDFGGLKLKLVASIAAISAIQLLKLFVADAPPDQARVFWMVIIHLTFIFSGVMLAVMDFLSAKAKSLGYEGD